MIVDDGYRKIKISDNILCRIMLFRQFNWDSPESGGVLAGRENISNNNLIVEYHTEPMDKDIKSRYRFKRKDEGHILFFKDMYEKSGGTVRYVGEWHTHPEDVPHYSIIDLNNWRKIYKEAKTLKEQYHIIVGRKSIVIWKCNSLKEPPINIATINCDEYNN